MRHSFLCDVQIPIRLTTSLRARGYAAEHALEIGYSVVDDRVIWNYAKDKRAIIVTKDSDFVKIAAAARIGPPVIYVRLGNCSNHWLIFRFFAALSGILDRIDSGHIVVELL